jgi:hypothetical protein
VADDKKSGNPVKKPEHTAAASKGTAGSSVVKRHAVANGLAALVSIAAVAWLKPQSAGGTGFVVGVIFIVLNLGGMMFRPLKATGLKPSIAWIMLCVVSTSIACCGAPTPVRVAAPTPVAASVRGLRPVRAFLPAGAIPPPGVGAYGIVAFTALPTAASRDRLNKVCLSYLATLPSQNSLPGSISISDQMITFWPTPASPPADSSCDWLIDNYDLFGGVSAIQDASDQGHPIRGRGPFLIGWSPSTDRGVKDAVVLVVDLSPFESQDSFDQQFEFWRQEIVENPSVWRSGFSLERLRLAIRDFADSHGSDIMSAIKVWGK